MTRILEGALVVATAVVTRVLGIAAVITVSAAEIAAAAPEGLEDEVAWLIRGAAWLLATVEVIRRSSPVPQDQRGILPTVTLEQPGGVGPSD